MKALLPAVLAGYAFASLSHAQDNKELAAPEVVVTATRFEEKPADQPVNVQVITSEQIRQSGARTLPELLSRQVGFQSRDNSGNPNRQIDLRGFGIFGDQNTLILLDGQRISENEQIPANLTGISLSSIERIEIVRGGGGGVLYGAGASAGTVNIVTRGPLPGDRQAYLRGSAGNYGTTAIGAGGSIASERVGLNVDVDRYDSDNYRDNNEVTQKNASLGARYFGDRGPVSVTVTHSEQDIRLPGPRTEAQLETDRRGTSQPNNYGSLDVDRIAFATTQRVGDAELGLDAAYRERHSLAGFGTDSIDTHGRVTSVSPRVRLPFDILGRRNVLVLGFDWEDWDYDSTAVFTGFPANTVSTQENKAVYFKDTFNLTERTLVSFGARQQRSETTQEDIVGLTPSQLQKETLDAYDVALRQGIGNAWGVYLRGGKSFRLANVDDNRFLTTLLEPQTSKDLEAGAEFTSTRASLRAAIYRMRLENEILFLPSNVFPPFGSNINLPPTERKGVEIDGTLTISEAWIVNANYTYTMAEFREGSFGGTDVTGKTVPLVPRHRANASLTWLPAAGATVSARIAYVGEQYFDNDQSNTFGRKMPDYTVTDLIASYDIGSWKFSASIYNLFNEKYFTYGILSGASFSAYPEAERSYLASAEYRFGR